MKKISNIITHFKSLSVLGLEECNFYFSTPSKNPYKSRASVHAMLEFSNIFPYKLPHTSPKLSLCIYGKKKNHLQNLQMVYTREIFMNRVKA